MSVLSIVEWVIWGIILACGLWFAIGIRTAAVRHAPPPLWPTLIMSFSLVFLPLIFLFLPFSKLHILWILFLLWKLSFMAGVGYIPLVSQSLIWPAYIYARILIMGTGVRLSSPSEQSPWAARKMDKLFQDLDSDPQIRHAAQAALDEFKSKEPERKAITKRLFQEIEELSDKWDREAEQYNPERERIIADFRTKEVAALATAKDEEERAIMQKDFKKKELALGKQLNERAAKIDGILHELNAKKEEVCQYLDPMTTEMLKSHNRAWRDD